jgi:chromosome partitioning protein
MASVGTGLPPAPQDVRGPELIEAGMVYVDPDPEIGSPPDAVRWAERPSARHGPEGHGGPADTPPGDDALSPNGGDEGQGGTGSAGVGYSLGSDALDDAVDPSGAQGVAAEETAVGEASVSGPGGAPASEPELGAAPAPGTVVEAEGATAIAGSQAADDGTDGSDELEAPWNEPALPMAWPPGMAPSDQGERGGSLHEDSDDGDLLPEPDPTWPKLFGHGSDPQETGGPTELADGLPATASVDQGSGDGNADHPLSGRQREVGERPPVVDIRSHGSGDNAGMQGSPEPGDVWSEGTDPQSETTTGARGGSGVDATSQANMSTVTQQAKSVEGEVDLRETPANPRSIDVSRETSAGGGGGMDPGLESEDLEDEAAVAVREAVSRAAAEAGVDVSRETEVTATDFSIDELGDEPSIDREAAARSARVTFRIDRDTLNGDRRVMAVANQKGGVGKSTTAVNIGAYLALAGARVLVVDLDPQGNASTGLGLDHREIEPSIYDVLTGDASPTAAIRATGVANLHVLPSTIDLAGAEVELVSAMSRETRLRRALESIDHQYDSILIDCPPSLGLLTVNALAAADELLIPIQCEYYALEGLGQLLRNVELVRANLNPELRIGGIVLTMYDGRTRLALQVVDEVRKHFTDVVYQTVVPRSVRLSEAPGYGLPIALYDPLSRGGIAYRDLTFELAERSGLLAPTGEGAS